MCMCVCLPTKRIIGEYFTRKKSIEAFYVNLNFSSLANTLVVRCGEYDTQTKDEEKPFQERSVAEIEVRCS